MSDIFKQYTFGRMDRAFYEGKKHLCVVRQGGFGDILMTTPVLHYLKKKYPDLKITYWTTKYHSKILKNNPDVDEIITTRKIDWMKGSKIPIPFDCYLDFNGMLERNPDKAETINAIDLAFERAKLPNPSDEEKIPIIKVPEKENKWADRQLEKWKVKRPLVMISIGASGNCRCWLPDRLIELTKNLSDAGVSILHIGHTWFEPKLKGIKGVIEKLNNPLDRRTGLTIGEVVALMSKCDLVISPDTANIHISAALGIPCVGLFGPFPADLRVRYYPLVSAIEGKTDCSPCIVHQNDCFRGRPSPCMAQIQTKDVLNETSKRLGIKISDNGYALKKDVCPVCGQKGEACHQLKKYWWVYCYNCGTYYLNQKPKDIPYTIYQDENFRGSQQSMNVRLERERDFRVLLPEVERITKGRRMLEIGSSVGWGLKEAIKRGWEAVGIDLDKGAVEYANTKGLRTILSDFSDYDFGKEKFDLVVSIHSLEHSIEPLKTLREMKGLLADNGVILIRTPNGDLSREKQPHERKDWIHFNQVIDGTHYCIFNPNSLMVAGRRVGLKVVKGGVDIEFQDFWSILQRR